MTENSQSQTKELHTQSLDPANQHLHKFALTRSWIPVLKEKIYYKSLRASLPQSPRTPGQAVTCGFGIKVGRWGEPATYLLFPRSVSTCV